MKNNKILAITLLAAIALVSGCKKNDSLVLLNLTTEDYQGDTKTTVTSNATYWEDGDVVKLNGTPYTVHVDGSNHVYVEADESVATASKIYGYFPATIISSGGNTDEQSVTIPSRYESSFSGGRQVLGIPMAARVQETQGTSINFVHLTGAINVRVKNSTGGSVYLDSINLVSSDYQLSGSKTINFNTSGTYGITPTSGATRVQKNVWLILPKETVTIENGSYKDVLVPILPIPSGESITVAIYTHGLVDHGSDLLSTDVDYKYQRTITAPAIARGQLSTAQIDVNPNAAPSYVTMVDHSLFSYELGHRLRFSKGNLRATTANLGANWAWSFAEDQYQVVGNAVGNNAISGHGVVSVNGTVDLFGWVGNDAPISTHTYGIDNSSTNSDYGSSTTDPLKSDWASLMGVEWVSLTHLEWKYLTYSRNVTSTLGENVRYIGAMVNYVPGLIVFPDNYRHPEDVTLTGYVANSVNNYSCSINISSWMKMQKAGCVFLPCGGRRLGAGVTSVSGVNGIGWYWTSAPNATNNTYANLIKFEKGSNGNLLTGAVRRGGCSVRLVQKVD